MGKLLLRTGQWLFMAGQKLTLGPLLFLVTFITLWTLEPTSHTQKNMSSWLWEAQGPPKLYSGWTYPALWSPAHCSFCRNVRRGNTSSIPKGRLYGEYGGEAVLRNPEKRISLVQRRPSGERKAGKGMDKSQCLPKTSTLSSERGPVRKHSLTQDTKLGPTLQSRVVHQAPLSWDSPGKNTGVDCHFLL